MPIRGARVRWSKWFDEMTKALQEHGFQRGAPGVIPCPGFYFYSRDGHTIQILPERKIRITRPNGMVDVETVRQLSKVNFILGALVRYIEANAASRCFVVPRKEDSDGKKTSWSSKGI
jgi:hypothetical protein